MGCGHVSGGMEETHVVTCFLRSGVEVLLLRRSDAVGSYAGRWGGVAGHAEGDPDAAARVEIREETGVDPATLTLVRRGDPLAVTDEDLGTRWVVHPYLFDCPDRPSVETDWESATHKWVQPSAILDRETVPDLWAAYRRVGPTVESVADDELHGSVYLSFRAVETLRDRAAAVAAGIEEGDADAVVALAEALLHARPAMAALRNRVNRAMANTDADPAAVAASARDVLDDAVRADRAAAALAADRIGGAVVATLSRSGTVLDALDAADVAGVLLPESRPGREGIGVAEHLAEDRSVTLVPDAAFPRLVERADVALVGADTVLPDGAVLNKVGTYPLALAAARARIPLYVVCSSDKVSPDDDVAPESGDPAGVYDGDAPVTVECPVFEVTPADLVDGVLTEDGLLDGAEVTTVAAEHRALADWGQDE
jgi:ribose 1,5-bisphosphate isomerase